MKRMMVKMMAAALVALMSLGTVVAANPTKKSAGRQTAPKKYGLFVGINDYPGNDMDLEGAVADARNLRTVMTSKFKFPVANTTLMINSAATRDNILKGIKAYGARAVAGDLFVFTYSGHGSLFPDEYSDELDETEEVEVDIDFGDGDRYQVPRGFYDSTIVPYDTDSGTSGLPWDNMILDDELYEAFSVIAQKGVNVVFISDSCHSGSVNKNETKKGVKPAKFRFMKPERALGIKSLADFKPGVPSGQKKGVQRVFSGNYIALTSASDNEVAMDGGGGIVGGLFTSLLIAEINRSTAPLTYKRLMDLVAPKVSRTSRDRFNNNQNPRLDDRFGDTTGTIFTPKARR